METILNDSTTWGVEAGKINDNFDEINELKNKIYDLNSFTVSEIDDLYAHESQLLIKKIGNIVFAFVMYKSDKSDARENRISAHGILKVYELTTRTLLKTFDLFYPGLSAGVTIDADKIITMQRMFVVGNTLRCVSGSINKLYYRDIDITSSTYAEWTAGNIAIMEMGMKDGEGTDITATIEPANVQAHLEYIMGDTHADYTFAAVDFLNSGNILVYDDVWYSVLELWAGTGNKNVNILVSSSDFGATWVLGNVIGYTTSNRVDLWEISLSHIGATFHAVARSGNTVYHYSSANFGGTWSAGNVLLSGLTYVSKPITVNYTNSAGTVKTLFGATLTSEVTGMTNQRTTFAIYETTDFITFTEIAKVVSPNLCHYPSIYSFSNALYWLYTKGLKYELTGTYPNGYMKNTIVLTRLV